MAPTNERKLTDAIVRGIQKVYGPEAWIFKVHGGPMQVSGIPDLLLCVRGYFIGIEVKFKQPAESDRHAHDRATPIQRAMLHKIIAAGGAARVVTSVDEALTVIDSVLKGEYDKTTGTSPARQGESE